MFDTLLRRLMAPSPDRLPDTDADLALAALLVRLARADGDYAAVEMARIDKILARRHGLAPDGASAMRAEAELLEQEAPDTVRFTRAIKEATALDDRTDLAQALWSVALADNSRSPEEDQLMRLVISLLGLTDQQSALARQRAAKA
ncbi:TerB family tellurite resistance protein [Pseudorhodobacter sp.]|uniref:tellurite resistance TerB family protein n=1 Tax=Pseudorhodobacter sp. TaxID=1934400 RepID=UPI002AFF7CBC|nr:TerB family tellurite resistance protein [Pseudorhodobacter sp.]